MNSFLTKYSALTNTTPEYLKSLFNYSQVKIGGSEFIHNGEFNFFYALHSIPCMGFTLKYAGKTFVYSSDHNNEPGLHKKLFDENVITEKRYNELKNFPWESDVIYHESGVPPLHTPIAYLNSLDKALQEKIVVYHIAKKDFVTDTSLTLAKFGIENTLYFDVESPRFEDVGRILGLFSYVDLFDELPISKAQEFISIVEEERFSKDEKIIEKGTAGDKFYIIYSGSVYIQTSDDLEQRKIYSEGDYFGEAALLTRNTRAADVIAETDVILYTIERDKFLNFIKGTDFKKALKNLAKVRDSETWNVLSTSPFFRILTSTQKTLLESMFQRVDISYPSEIQAEGEPINGVYIIRDGYARVFKNGEAISALGRGEYIGSMVKIHRDEVSEFTFKNERPISLYLIDKEDIGKFLEKNPGLIMKLVHDFMQID